MRVATVRFSTASVVKFALSVAVLACGLAAFASLPRSIRFESASDARAALEGEGLYVLCTTSSNNFYVSDRPLSPGDLEKIGFLKNCGRSLAWHGIVWISQIKSSSSTMYLDQLDGNWRVWGDVVAVGDDRLMKSIEQKHR